MCVSNSIYTPPPTHLLFRHGLSRVPAGLEVVGCRVGVQTGNVHLWCTGGAARMQMLHAVTALVVRYQLWCVCVCEASESESESERERERERGRAREKERERERHLCVCLYVCVCLCACVYVHIFLHVRTSPDARRPTPCPTSARLARHTARFRVHRSTSARNAQESPAHYTDL